MKKTFYLIGILVFMYACGSTSDVSTGKVKVQDDECQTLAEERSAFLRGYGIGTSADKMMARDLANLAARNEIVNQVKVMGSNLITKYNEQRSSANQLGLTVEEQGKVEQIIKSMAEEEITGARGICANTYLNKNNLYEVHVCVELTNVDFAAKAYNKLTNDEKLMIDYDAEKFKEEFKQEIEEYRQRRQQGL